MNFYEFIQKKDVPIAKKQRDVLDLAKVEYRVYKLGKDFTKDQFISEFGYGSSFPKNIGGW